MKIIVIHDAPDDSLDTVAYVASTDNLKNIRFTEVDPNGGTEYVKERKSLKMQFRMIQEGFLGLLGMRRAG